MGQSSRPAIASPSASQIGTRVWSYAGVLKDDGLSYMAYVEQLTFLLFLKMADELTKAPYSQPNRIPKGKDKKGTTIAYDWSSLLNKDGAELYQHYRDVLEFLSTQPMVVPDNVLFEGGPGQKIREQLLKQCDVHTLLRLPTGIFYKPGVKANVLFFDRKAPQENPWTKAIWVYDLRTNRHFTQKQNAVKRSDFDEFVKLYKPGAIPKRQATWTEENPGGRWRSYRYDELLKRDKLSLDLFWIKDESLEDSASLPIRTCWHKRSLTTCSTPWSNSRTLPAP